MGRAVSGFLYTNFSQPMERAVAAISEGGMAALQAPVSIAMAGARMSSGIITVRLTQQHAGLAQHALHPAQRAVRPRQAALNMHSRSVAGS